jgi:hypothetical protein
MSLRSLFALVLLCSIYCAIAVAVYLPYHDSIGLRIAVGILWFTIGYTLALKQDATFLRKVSIVMFLLSFPLAFYEAMKVEYDVIGQKNGWIQLSWYYVWIGGYLTAPILAIAMSIKRRFFSATALFAATLLTYFATYFWMIFTQ